MNLLEKRPMHIFGVFQKPLTNFPYKNLKRLYSLLYPVTFNLYPAT
jgi:hypothetical protein